MLSEVLDLHAHRSSRDALLRVNNASARETSLLSQERFDRMINSASVATFIAPGKAFLLEQVGVELNRRDSQEDQSVIHP